MKRRQFSASVVKGGMLAGVAGQGSAPAQSRPRKNTRMHVGGDYHSVAGGDITSKTNLEYNLRYGVRHLTPSMRDRPGGGGWDLDELKRMKDNCDRHGVVLEAIRMEPTYITQSQRADRDRHLDQIVGNIRKAAQVGVGIITYHWTVIPIRRNQNRPGRGGVTYSAFKLEDNWRNLPVGPSGRVSSEEYWERIAYFLEKAIPAAKENNVRMACHPYDPPGLPLGYQGADNWDSPSLFDALKRYESLADTPFNGFQLCLGTTAEGLRDPNREILPIVQYLGERGKIHQIHMRNIRGGLHDFAEVYPDEGDVDFFRVMRVLRDVQFSGAICPDHMPRHPDDPGSLQSFAFGYGYLQALIRAVNSEAA
ncbi:MAG: mannonate dehydratase [Acidobacteria bacterium]|nr:mannonate dehydratase [Acidobacteriota bacterium]